jgi:uncharacterized membrane protein
MAEAPERYCSNCGHELSPEDQFCPNCGRPVHETAHVPTQEANVPVPPTSVGGAGQQAQQGERRGMFGSAFGVGLGGCLGIIAAIIVVFFLIAFCSLAFSGGGGGGGGDKNKGASRADRPAALAYSSNLVEEEFYELRRQQSLGSWPRASEDGIMLLWWKGISRRSSLGGGKEEQEYAVCGHSRRL